MFVDARGIAGVEPAVGVQHLSRGLRCLPVAAHDVGAASEQLAVVSDTDLHLGQRSTDRTDPLLRP